MTLQPVLPLLLLAAVAAAIVVARVVALRRLTAAGRTRTALWRWCGLTLAALLLLVAAARPVFGSDDQGTIRAAGDGDPTCSSSSTARPTCASRTWQAAGSGWPVRATTSRR